MVLKKRPWKLCNCNFQNCKYYKLMFLVKLQFIQYSKYSKMLYSIFNAPLPNPSNQLIPFKKNMCNGISNKQFTAYYCWMQHMFELLHFSSSCLYKPICCIAEIIYICILGGFIVAPWTNLHTQTNCWHLTNVLPLLPCNKCFLWFA